MQTQLKTYLSKINSALLNYLPRDQSRVLEAARYSLLAGGKRLRPVLTVAYFEALTGKTAYRLVYQAACSLEYLHTFSLIHDDLPGIDNDQLRRGVPTCHVQFDEATAILAGDYLLTWALENLDRLKVAPLIKLQLIRVLTKTTRLLLQGEMTDILGERASLSREQLRQMYGQKTGALLGACFSFAAILAGKNQPKDLHLAQELGHDLGLAFQIQDDVLGAIGDPFKLGKSVGLDEAAHKSTWVRIYNLEVAQTDYHQYYHRVEDRLRAKLPASPAQQFLLELMLYLAARDH